jgi:ABC-type methionine transport system permease subunit
MLNLIQHLTKSRAYETLKRVQGDTLRLFTRSSILILSHYICLGTYVPQTSLKAFRVSMAHLSHVNDFARSIPFVIQLFLKSS